MPGSPGEQRAPVEVTRERGDRVRAAKLERLGSGQQIVVGGRVADVLAAALVAAAAHHDRGRDALESAGDRLRCPLVGEVVDEHGQRRDAFKGSHGRHAMPRCLAQPPKPARVWLSPEAPGGLADAVRRAGGELVTADDANVVVWYGYEHLRRDQVPLARSLLRDSVRWVQLDSAGIEPWVQYGLVDGARIWTSAAGAYAVAVARVRPGASARLRQAAPRVRSRSLLAASPSSRAGRSAAARSASSAPARIGRETIRLLEPFGVRVLALTRSGARRAGSRSLGRAGRPRRAARRRASTSCCARRSRPRRRA